MSREDTLYQLNKDFVQQDAALIKDVAESCLYDYGKSYEALANLFHGNSLTEQPKLLQSVLVPTEEVVDQQTVPEMPRILPVGSDQSVPSNGGASYAARFNGTGPKPNSGAIRKSAVFNHKQRKKIKETSNLPSLERIKAMLCENWNVMVILRGLPGSGKSYFSKELIEMAEEQKFDHQVCSADHYFMKPNGKYEFNQYDLQRAHESCQANAQKALSNKTPLVVIDNTNSVDWEMKFYIFEGVKNEYHIELWEASTGWCNNVGQLVQKTIHNVPERTIRNMKERFQTYTIDQLLRRYQLTNKYQRSLSNDSVLKFDAPVVKMPKENGLSESSNPGENYSTAEPKADQIVAEENHIMSESEEEIIDYEGVPESARVFYKNLPVLYCHVDAETLRQIFRDCHFDQEYFFEAMENSAALLEKKSLMSLKPLISPAVNIRGAPLKIDQPTPSTSKKKVTLHQGADAIELKKAIEEKFVFAKPGNSKFSLFSVQQPAVPENVESEDDAVDTTPSTPSSSSSDEEEYEMQLDVNFARNMLLDFGGAYAVEDLPPDAFQVKIPASLALQIHSFWMEAVEKNLERKQRELNAQLRNDEAIAHALAIENVEQPEENPNMDDILEMEKALLAVKNLQIKDGKNDLATKLSREKLRNEFPNVDPVAIDSIFESNNRDYGEAARIIQEQYMTDTGAINVYTPEALKKREEELMQQALQESIKMLQAEERKKPLFVEVIPVNDKIKTKMEKANFETEIAKYRDEANEERNKKIKYIGSMQAALQRKHFGVASYYKLMVDACDANCNMLNQKVSALILQNSSLECLDLHYLHVREAINAVELFLDHHVYLRETNSKLWNDKVKIVTGRGRRSHGGIPKLWPAIKKYLDDHKIKYTYDAGSFTLDISKDLQYSKNYIDE
ncbi:NEDD4-binding protein 2-like isoform X1 [Cloeon dipterum]|uniref:NEDD4-binding protein 2-like isoform X1 n=1 Tax=Cloeon dipterum TaxID=197152 RepID=UPI00321F6D75